MQKFNEFISIYSQDAGKGCPLCRARLLPRQFRPIFLSLKDNKGKKTDSSTVSQSNACTSEAPIEIAAPNGNEMTTGEVAKHQSITPNESANKSDSLGSVESTAGNDNAQSNLSLTSVAKNVDQPTVDVPTESSGGDDNLVEPKSIAVAKDDQSSADEMIENQHANKTHVSVPVQSIIDDANDESNSILAPATNDQATVATIDEEECDGGLAKADSTDDATGDHLNYGKSLTSNEDTTGSKPVESIASDEKQSNIEEATTSNATNTDDAHKQSEANTPPAESVVIDTSESVVIYLERVDTNSTQEVQLPKPKNYLIHDSSDEEDAPKRRRRSSRPKKNASRFNLSEFRCCVCMKKYTIADADLCSMLDEPSV